MLIFLFFEKDSARVETSGHFLLCFLLLCNKKRWGPIKLLHVAYQPKQMQEIVNSPGCFGPKQRLNLKLKIKEACKLASKFKDDINELPNLILILDVKFASGIKNINFAFYPFSDMC